MAKAKKSEEVLDETALDETLEEQKIETGEPITEPIKVMASTSNGPAGTPELNSGYKYMLDGVELSIMKNNREMDAINRMPLDVTKSSKSFPESDAYGTGDDRWWSPKFRFYGAKDENSGHLGSVFYKPNKSWHISQPIAGSAYFIDTSTAVQEIYGIKRGSAPSPTSVKGLWTVPTRYSTESGSVISYMDAPNMTSGINSQDQFSPATPIYFTRWGLKQESTYGNYWGKISRKKGYIYASDTTATRMAVDCLFVSNLCDSNTSSAKHQYGMFYLPRAAYKGSGRSNICVYSARTGNATISGIDPDEDSDCIDSIIFGKDSDGKGLGYIPTALAFAMCGGGGGGGAGCLGTEIGYVKTEDVTVNYNFSAGGGGGGGGIAIGVIDFNKNDTFYFVLGKGGNGGAASTTRGKAYDGGSGSYSGISSDSFLITSANYGVICLGGNGGRWKDTSYADHSKGGAPGDGGRCITTNASGYVGITCLSVVSGSAGGQGGVLFRYIGSDDKIHTYVKSGADGSCLSGTYSYSLFSDGSAGSDSSFDFSKTCTTPYGIDTSAGNVIAGGGASGGSICASQSQGTASITKPLPAGQGGWGGNSTGTTESTVPRAGKSGSPGTIVFWY